MAEVVREKQTKEVRKNGYKRKYNAIEWYQTFKNHLEKNAHNGR